MAIVVTTQAETHRVQRGEETITARLKVTDDAGAAVTHAQASAAAGTVGSEYLSMGSSTGLYVTAVEVASLDGSGGRAWEATVTASDQLADEDYTATESAVDPALVDTWRTGASLPANLSSPTDADIGGSAVDSGGEPVTRIVPVQTLSVTNITASSPDTAAIRAYIGRRNSLAFLGASAGYVVFRGARIRRTGPARWEATYDFAWDEQAHLRQMAVLDADGRPRLGAPDPVTNVAHATGVVWRQPFPETADLAGLGIVL